MTRQVTGFNGTLFAHLALLFGWGLVAFSTPAPVAAQGAPTKEVVSNDRLATCFDERTGAFAGSMQVRNEVLVAPDGGHRAYTLNLATGDIRIPSNTPGGWLAPECANITRIFVADGRGKDFRLALTILPTEATLLNAAWVVDWSPDSRYLLFRLLLSQWGSDFGVIDALLYDARSNTFTDPELAYQAFKKRSGRDCVLGSVLPLGFSPEGKVVLKAGPAYPPENDEPEPNSCLQKSGTWLYDPATGNLTECPDNYQVKRFAKFEAH